MLGVSLLEVILVRRIVPKWLAWVLWGFVAGLLFVSLPSFSWLSLLLVFVPQCFVLYFALFYMVE